MINSLLPEKIDEINFLNFGAGNGGISHLMWLRGGNIFNIEPSEIKHRYNERWTTFKNIQEITDKSIDFIYSSHALEHVLDIDVIINEFSRVKKDKCIFFAEVPNATHPKNGPMSNSVIPPHTYYFEKKFFSKFIKDMYHISTYDPDYRNIQEWKTQVSDNGSVIRVMGLL